MDFRALPPLALLAEDNPDAVELFTHLFRGVCPHWRLLRASDGLEAVSVMMEQGFPDLLVTDLQMPRMTGEELIVWVRTHRALPRVPIIAMSFRSEPGLRDHLCSLGADEFICKSSTLSEIKNSLRRYTDHLGDTRVPANNC